MTDEKRVLWLDDNNEFVDRAARLLEPYGFVVDTAYDAEGTRKYLKAHRYDFIIADYNLGADKTGLDVILQIRSKERQKDTVYLLVSSCFGSSIPPETIPAGIGAVPINSQWFSDDRAFAKEIVAILDEGVSILDMPFDVYEALSLEAREAYLDDLLELLDTDESDLLPTDDTLWMLICGRDADGRPLVLRYAEDPSDIATDNEVWELARRHRHAPIQIFADAEVEDCQSARDLRSYPTISFRLPNDSRAFAVHFDSGTVDMWVDASFWSDIGVLPRMRVPGAGRLRRRSLPDGSEGTKYVGGRRAKQTVLDVEVILHCQITGDTSLHTIRVRAVRDWMKTDLVSGRLCQDQKCKVSDNPDGLCEYRRGLFGRSLILQTGVGVSLVATNDTISTRLEFNE
jgi:CheY-like chemotaxis protein